jgi:hypothetical protein
LTAEFRSAGAKRHGGAEVPSQRATQTQPHEGHATAGSSSQPNEPPGATRGSKRAFGSSYMGDASISRSSHVLWALLLKGANSCVSSSVPELEHKRCNFEGAQTPLRSTYLAVGLHDFAKLGVVLDLCVCRKVESGPSALARPYHAVLLPCGTHPLVTPRDQLGVPCERKCRSRQ